MIKAHTFRFGVFTVVVPDISDDKIKACAEALARQLVEDAARSLGLDVATPDRHTVRSTK